MSQIVEIIMKVLQWFTIARMRRETGLCGAMHAPDLNDPYFCTRTREHGAQDHHTFVNGEAIRWPNMAPNDQARAIARVTYLLPELTDEARAAVLAVCEAAPKRSLDRAALDEQQRAREGLPPVCDDCGALARGVTCDVACAAGMPSGLNPEPVEEQASAGPWERLQEAVRIACGELTMGDSRALREACSSTCAAVAEEHDREMAALRAQVEGLTAQAARVERAWARLRYELEPDELAQNSIVVSRVKTLDAAINGEPRQPGEAAAEHSRGEMLRAAWLALNDLPASEIARALGQIRKAPKNPEIVNARASAPESRDSNRAGVLGPAMVAALSTIVPAPRPVPGEVADVENGGERGPRRSACLACREYAGGLPQRNGHTCGVRS